MKTMLVVVLTMWFGQEGQDAWGPEFTLRPAVVVGINPIFCAWIEKHSVPQELEIDNVGQRIRFKATLECLTAQDHPPVGGDVAP